MEEIYPPKLAEFAYVTDGACRAEQILDKELAILKTLDWNLSSVTVHAWLNLFTQICNNHSTLHSSNHSIVIPNHSIQEFLQSSQLLDLCLLDEGSLKYSYSVLAASSVYLTSYKDQIFFASGTFGVQDYLFLDVFGFHSLDFILLGLQWSDIAECVDWMSAFAQVIKEEKLANSPIRTASSSSSSSVEESYLIQTHTVDLGLLVSSIFIFRLYCVFKSDLNSGRAIGT